MTSSRSAQSLEARILGKLERLLSKGEARFPSNHLIMIESEMVSVMLDFSIRGAWLDSARDKPIVHVTVDDWAPKEVDLYPEMVEDLVSITLETELPWMKDVEWHLSVDRESLRNLRRGEKKKKYLMHITSPIKKGELRSTEAVEVLSNLLVELRPELTDVLVSNGLAKGQDSLVRIENKGMPCPLCLGHLSEHAISSMFHRLRFEAMFDGDDDDDEINNR